MNYCLLEIFAIIAMFVLVFYLTMKTTMYIVGEIMVYKEYAYTVFGYRWGMTIEDFLIKHPDAKKLIDGRDYATYEIEDPDDRVKKKTFEFNKYINFGLYEITSYPEKMTYIHGALCEKYGAETWSQFTSDWYIRYFWKTITYIEMNRDKLDIECGHVIYRSEKFRKVSSELFERSAHRQTLKAMELV